MADVKFQKKITIAASREEVWNALVSPEAVEQYHLAPLHRIELKKEGRIIYGTEDKVMISGRILEIDAPQKLVHTFVFGPEATPGTQADAATTVSYTLSENGSETILTLVHSDFEEENQTFANIAGGWPHILENLKKMLHP